MTAEATPHHLALTEERLTAYDPVFKVNPPLRPTEDAEALREALADGTVDVVATDHAPHARHDKEHAFVDAANGMIGLETSFAVVADLMVRSGRMGWGDLARVMSAAPARIAGLAGHGRPVAAGEPANLVLVDPSRTWTVDRDASQSQARNNPWHGMSFTGAVHTTILRGQRDRAGGRDPPMLTDREPAVLILEDGRTFVGKAYGHRGETVGEAVFSTGMTGYQETLTDPSYHRQVVVMTSPHVGNTGWNDEDDESARIWVAGYVVRDPALRPSSWRSRRTLEEELDRQGVVGICDIDTRALTRHLRERGAMRVGIFSGAYAALPREHLLTTVIDAPAMVGADLACEVATKEPYVVPAAGERRFTVAAVDLGIKAMTPAMMAQRGIEVHVLPADATLEQVEAVGPDGVFFSNGPGDPATADHQTDVARGVLRAGIPVFGICFGNQILGRALGFGTYKLKYGHRGINQPVMDRTTGKVEVTAHNHGFAVDAPLDRDADTEFGRVRVSHVCLNDDVVEGLECLDVPAFSVQYHPEAAAGPHDAAYLFDRFVELMGRTGRTPRPAAPASEGEVA